MKLIYLANARIPTEKAHGVHIVQMCEAFADCGAQVELVVPRRRNPIKSDAFQYYGVRNNFRITKIPCLDLLAHDRVFPFAFLLQTATFLLAAKIYLFFRKYDLLYTREQLVGLAFRNFVLELHFLPKTVKAAHNKIYGRAKKIVILTSGIKDLLIGYGVPLGKIIVEPDGVNLEKFGIEISKDEARKKIGLPLDKKIALYWGSFFRYEYKGVRVLLEATRYFNNEFLFVLVGGSDQEIKLAGSEYDTSNIKLLGHQQYYLAPIYMKAADVLLLPNKSGDIESEQYTSPLKMFEYMASGRVIVATKLPSLREILDENCAILVESNSAESLAAGIKETFADPQKSEKLARRAKEIVANHSWQKRASRILNFIE